SKPDVVGLDEVARPDGVVLQERTPALTVPRWPDGVDVTLDGALGDTDVELQELAADPFCAPGTVIGGHATNELYGVRCDAGLPRRRSLRFAPPEQPKAFAMPAENGLWFHEEMAFRQLRSRLASTTSKPRSHE